jgi:phosphoribosylformylglycinamidine cyclo-ligase
LIGGEMAEHPGAMEPGEFDLVGFSVGVVDRDRIITGATIAPGDVVIGLPSTNLRSNGYSLVRRVLFERAGRSLDAPAFDGAHHSLAEELLKPSVIYAPAIMALIDAVDVRGVAHITGGGITGNVARVLPSGTSADIDRRSWEAPRIFGELQTLGGIDDGEMARVFNLGLGMIVVVPEADAYRSLDVLRAHGHRASEVGRIVAGDGTVHLA